MVKICLLFVVILLILNLRNIECKKVSNVQEKPNIVMILGDDLGSYDLSLRGNNQIMTPNLDALGYQGVIFNRHYTPAMCTPTRSALLTGKYPIHTGMQHIVILPDEPRGLPLNEKILPQYLKEAGYRTHLVGKWHLGYARKAFIPTQRGFDSYVGFLNGYLDYFVGTFDADFGSYAIGYDFWRNETVYRDRVGEYLPDVIADEASKMILGHNPSEGPIFLFVSQVSPHTANPSDPLQTIPEDLQKMEHIQDPIRRSYAAMVRALDRSVGTVIRALEEKKMLENTLIVFFSDNGGQTVGRFFSHASNYPLKGQKDSPWEGGLRGTALVWSPLLKQRHYVSDHLIHVTDWFSTFTELAGVPSHKCEKRDGNNFWSTLSLNRTPIRREIVHNINLIDGYSSYYFDGWKYVNGTTLDGIYDSWFGDMVQEDSPESFYYSQLVMNSDVWQALNPYSTRILKPNDLDTLRGKTKINCERRNPKLIPCEPLKAPCLFNLEEDPCELNNLANIYPLRMKYMKKRVNDFQATALPPANLPGDQNADPALNGGLWTWWLDR
ncbi:arylsulfatase I-like [Phlebotomus papatasi]|uniref:arylsulfatase I-like n=1 Tax=Phlebotomus papatasi TaxID=29031 RepID=UPI002483AF4F|nr:arylsulfatase I-like [Phlebotomus papatasi]